MGPGLPFAVNLGMDAQNRVYSPTPAEPSFHLRALLLSSFKKKKEGMREIERKKKEREGESEREGGEGGREAREGDERRTLLEVKQHPLT